MPMMGFFLSSMRRVQESVDSNEVEGILYVFFLKCAHSSLWKEYSAIALFYALYFQYFIFYFLFEYVQINFITVCLDKWSHF